MTELVNCPNCNEKNRPGARFCKECGTNLSSLDAATIPLNQVGTNRLNDQPGNPVNQTVISGSAEETRRSGNTKPLEKNSTFDSRPSGAIFGDRFLAQGLIFTEDKQHMYEVSQIPAGDERPILMCPNPSCGAVHPPEGAVTYYCTDCGAGLGVEQPALTLTETLTPLYDNVDQITEKALSHGNIRAPVAAFKENLGGEERFCVVDPSTQPIVQSPDQSVVLSTSIELAHALYYLYENGITFDGQVDSSRFALDEDQIVWAHLDNCNLDSTTSDVQHQEDVRALAVTQYSWLTGKSHYEHDPNLTDQINDVFENAITNGSYSTGLELAIALQDALDETAAPQRADYFSGRRTDVGMARTLNEDSLLLIETTRNLQDINHPVGVYVVADGMGGHAAGEVASSTIVNTIAEKTYKDMLPSVLEKGGDFNFRQWEHESVLAANKNVYGMRKVTASDLGSTLVMALLERDNAFIAHVGDSRAYLINTDGIHRITIDHSLVERLIASGQITREEARIHPQRNVIYRTIGDKKKIEVDQSTLKLFSGDQLLLCSDGLNGMITDEKIRDIVLTAPSPQEACDKLINAANKAGGDDNITVIIIKLMVL